MGLSGSLFVWEGSRKGEHNWYEDQLEGLSSVSLWLTAPSAEGTFWGARLRTRGLSSVMRVAHDSSFCRRSQVEFRLCGGEAVAFRSPPPPLRAPLIDLYRMKRWQGAAALSAAVTTTALQEPAPNVQAESSQKKSLNPNANCSSGGSARRGKTAIAASGG